jgi:hypothetical protein
MQHIYWGNRTVSLCAMFWAGVMTLLVCLLFLALPVLVLEVLAADGLLKETAVVGGVLAVVGGLLWLWGKTSDFYVPPSVEQKAGVVAEAVWGLKNRVCPVVRLED